MEKGSITSLIDSLEDLGLIYKEADKNDRRRFWILLTDEGKNFYEKQRNITNSEIERIFENSTDEEINQFNKDLLNLIKILERND